MVWLERTLLYYGIFNIALGIWGFVEGSPISLAAGGGAGVLVIVAAWIAKTRPTIGHILAALVCLALLGRFVMLSMKEFKWVPGGIEIIASSIVLICLVAGHLLGRRATGSGDLGPDEDNSSA